MLDGTSGILATSGLVLIYIRKYGRVNLLVYILESSAQLTTFFLPWLGADVCNQYEKLSKFIKSEKGFSVKFLGSVAVYHTHWYQNMKIFWIHPYRPTITQHKTEPEDGVFAIATLSARSHETDSHCQRS